MYSYAELYSKSMQVTSQESYSQFIVLKTDQWYGLVFSGFLHVIFEEHFDSQLIDML